MGMDVSTFLRHTNTMSQSRHRAAALLLLAAAPAVVFADPASTTAPAASQSPSPWSLDINLASWHTRAWARRQLSQRNPGVGIQRDFSPDWSAMAGLYSNSYRKPTWYALAAWTPLRAALPAGLSVGAGIAAGLVSGYTKTQVRSEPLAAGAVLRLRSRSGLGLNLLAVPNSMGGSGFLGLQVVAPL